MALKGRKNSTADSLEGKKKACSWVGELQKLRSGDWGEPKTNEKLVGEDDLLGVPGKKRARKTLSYPIGEKREGSQF